MAKLSEYLTNIFLIILLLQFAPVLIRSIKKQYTNLLEQRTQVGYLIIKGEINDSTYYIKHLRKYFENNNIKAILLKVDSPGGAAGSTEAIAHEIEILKKEHPKPIITLVENVDASGAYYISVATDCIIAPYSALIGSVGSSIPYQFKLKDFIEQYKIHYNVIKAGDYKSVTDPFVDTTPEQNAQLQSIAQDSYDNFAEHVIKHRHRLSRATIAEWGNGKLMTAGQAVKLGMIDQIGSRSDAILKIKEMAVISGAIEWIKPPKPGGFWNMFSGRESDSDDEDSVVSNLVNTICLTLENRYSNHSVQT